MLSEKFKNKKIILASQSPRRQELLNGLGLPFQVLVKSGIEEPLPALAKKEEIAIFLAEHKAAEYHNILLPETILIPADTIVWLAGQVLNKPQNFEQAEEMLQCLSGRQHSVVTGVCVSSFNKKISFHSTTKVWFKKLSNEEIKFYINTYKPFDKAGAYGIQEWIGFIGIEKIEGSYFNVMGLPIQKLCTVLLEEFADDSV